MKRVALVEEGNTSTPGGRSQSDIALSRILEALEPHKKRAPTAMQQWMHENWREGANLSELVSAKWDERPDKSVTNQPPQFRLNVTGEIYEKFSDEEKERWLARAREQVAPKEDDVDGRNDPVAVAA